MPWWCEQCDRLELGHAGWGEIEHVGSISDIQTAEARASCRKQGRKLR